MSSDIAMSGASRSASLGTSKDLRKSRRYFLSAPCSFCWVAADGTLHEKLGTTRDVCLTGIFVVADEMPLREAPVEVDVFFLPPSGEKTVQLHGEGKVTRLQDEGMGLRGFAADLTFEAKAAAEKR